jgi:hypothetical protein
MEEKTKPYKLFSNNSCIRINHIQALSLELKLNVSQYGRKWILLGDVLYKWRLDPEMYNISIAHEYSVTEDQIEWIRENNKK